MHEPLPYRHPCTGSVLCLRLSVDSHADRDLLRGHEVVPTAGCPEDNAIINTFPADVLPPLEQALGPQGKS